MKHSIILFLFLCLAFVTHAQDTIITQKGDTISCKITRISEQYIHYMIQEQSLRSRIPLDQVASFTQQEPEEPKQSQGISSDPINVQEPEVEEPPFANLPDLDDLNTWRLGVNVGYTYQFGGYGQHPQDYQRQVRSLLYYGGEVQYFTSSTFGFGVKLNQIRTTTSADMLFNLSDVRETITFTYLALTLINRQSSVYDNNLLYYAASVGLVSYLDDGFINGLPYLEEGRTIGFNFELGYDYVINANYGMGVNLGVNLANLRSLTVNGTNVPNADFSLARVDLTVGFRMFR